MQTSRCSRSSARTPWLSMLCLELCDYRSSCCTYAQKHISLLGNVALTAWEIWDDSGCTARTNLQARTNQSSISGDLKMSVVVEGCTNCWKYIFASGSWKETIKLWFGVSEMNLSKMMPLICSPDVGHTESFGLEISPAEVRSSPFSLFLPLSLTHTLTITITTTHSSHLPANLV